MSDTRQDLWDIFTEAVQTFDKKNADYGDAWRRNGWRGNLSRIFEKADRVRNLAWRPDPRVPAVGDESVVETLRDMLNTIAFAIMNLEEEVEYGHEVPRTKRFSEMEKAYTPGAASQFYDEVSAELSHGHDEPVTTRITVDPNVVREQDLSMMNVGPDEQGAAEKKHDAVPRRPRTKAVADNPQA
jgi:hypothetical protein